MMHWRATIVVVTATAVTSMAYAQVELEAGDARPATEPIERGQETEASAAGPSDEAAIRTIDLDEVLELAASQGFVVLRAKAEAQVGDAQDTEALWRLVPSVRGQLGLVGVSGATQSSSTGAFDNAEYSTASPYAWIGYGANPVEAIYGKVASGRTLRALEAEIAVAERSSQELAADQYFDLVQARANLKVAKMAVKDAGDLLRIATVLEQEGLGRGDDVTRARSELAAAQQNKVRAERALHQASIRLAGTLVLDPTAMLSPADQDLQPRAVISGEDVQNYLETALRQRPEVSAARARLSASEAITSAAWATVLAPTIEAFYQEGGYGPDYATLGSRRVYGGMLTWTLSGTSIASISTAGAREEVAAVGILESEQLVSTEVADGHDGVHQAKQRLPFAAEGVKSAEDTLRISNVRFQNGTAILIEVIQAQKAVEIARLNQVAATVDYNRAQVRLQLALGVSRKKSP